MAKKSPEAARGRDGAAGADDGHALLEFAQEQPLRRSGAVEAVEHDDEPGRAAASSEFGERGENGFLPEVDRRHELLGLGPIVLGARGSAHRGGHVGYGEDAELVERLSERVDEASLRRGFGHVDECVGLARVLGHRDPLAARGASGARIEADAATGDDAGELLDDAALARALAPDQERVAAAHAAAREFVELGAVSDHDRIGQNRAGG